MKLGVPTITSVPCGRIFKFPDSNIFQIGFLSKGSQKIQLNGKHIEKENYGA